MTLRNKLYIASNELFQAALLTYMILTVVETLRQGTVSNFFNMNYLLAIVLVVGMVMVTTESIKKQVTMTKPIRKQTLSKIIDLRKNI